MLCTLVAFVPCRLKAQSYSPAYHLLSASEDEVVVSLDPVFHLDTVLGTNGETFTHVTARGANSSLTVGGADIPQLHLQVLTPSRVPVRIEIVGQDWRTQTIGMLAPVPEIHHSKEEAKAIFRVDPAHYTAVGQWSAVIEPVHLFRTSYQQAIDVPLGSYDVHTGTMKLLEHAEVHIHISKPYSAPRLAEVSQAEQEMFVASAVNGNMREWYRAAEPEALMAVHAATPNLSSKAASLKAASVNGEQWLTVETGGEGIYKITSDDLHAAGISGNIDTATIQLFGAGAKMLSETVTSQTGELRECALQVHANADGSLHDLYFYAPGAIGWKYDAQSNRLLDMWHTQNCFTSSGRYLLKIGGTTRGLRIPFTPDTTQPSGSSSNLVFTATVHHDGKRFEHPNFSRTFIGDRIPLDGSTAQYSIAAPGYSTADWAYIRPAIDVAGTTTDSRTYSVPITVNGASIGTLTGVHPTTNDDLPDPIERNWNTGFYLPASMGTPSSIEFSMTSTEDDAHGWVAWFELFYHRTTDLGSGTIPFYLVDTTGTFAYAFTNASGAQVWDVDADALPVEIGASNGGTMTVNVQGIPNDLRRLMAFTPSTVQTVHLTLTAAPTLRATIGQTGAEDIIIAPATFLDQANELKALREAGGEATEPLKTVVVSLDDIYREFGYGIHDFTAIRDFLAYTFRHTTAAKTTVPLFVTLFGSGHADYQNRVTSLPDYIPVFEFDENDSRTDAIGANDIVADDLYFGRLTNNQLPDVGVGRLSVQSTDEASAVLTKLKHYEHGSAQGIWRSIGSFASDDRMVANGRHDALAYDHINDTENEIARLQKRIVVHKLYEVNYPTVVTALGFKKPAAESAVIDAFNAGSVLFSFIGHGNPTVWTHEDMLKVPATIEQMTNFDKLPFVTTATCDFSMYDDYNVHSGGVLLLTLPTGGAVSLLGTTRQIYAGERFVGYFYDVLLGPNCSSNYGSAHIGTALMIGKQEAGPGDGNAISFYLQGDPALRLLVPRQFVFVDSIQGVAVGEANTVTLPALSRVTVAARISNTCDGSEFDGSFNGTATITLYDSPQQVVRVSTFTDDPSPETDRFTMLGPILYRGTATVTNGRLSAVFVVPKDVKLDSAHAQFSILAYSNDNRAALGVDSTLRLTAADPKLIGADTTGPTIAAYLGSRYFKPYDTVATHSLLIVDVHDTNGLNTSTASVGHSFIAWIDDSTNGSFDLASNYVSVKDDYTTGTSTEPVQLPLGLHTLHVRAFDAIDNPTVVDLPFVARDASGSFRLFEVGTFPNPMRDHVSFKFMQPAGEGAPVAVRISIFTTDGRRMRDIEAGTTTSSNIIATWDGRDAAGVPLVSGAYLYQIIVANINSGATTHYNGRIIIQR